MVEWQWARLEGLDNRQLYEILRVRQEVFTVEQDCAYQDADGRDWDSWHLCGWDTRTPEPHLLAYLRVVDPGKKYREPAIGRVLTALSARGTGLGRELVRRAVLLSDDVHPGAAIRISAQLHLAGFYRDFGFEQVSEPYDEDGIPHIEMLRPVQ
ncbi:MULTISPECIES: GNAT family N-acetyltransferase [Microbulbifer]|uniref:GNAT family N-acetyltransferase n=1 Tax=Microbulbifer TaxID=48073 RepID=UPI001E56E8FA|nr:MULTISPECIES: GNAT family N-acetyltransferase [Microbulbifer]UHQ55209.1 GNAT family N-acetyltransferase [Microbulbifer sp. YPW16]